ncbi:MAG TPA: sulfatase, partial [Candidatus Hydrogenedentes bacterium]|nr:sulfatase [Candidatus Hydrogenedentota bacterium]
MALCASGKGLNALAQAGESRKPNIIYILADDLGYGDLGCYGQETIKTPNIDRMAAEGLKFTQHYAGSTVCAPSRACLLTGFHTGHVHVRGNGDYILRPSPDDMTIAERLKEAGYHTAMIGKASVGSNNLPLDLPREKGFDYFFGYLGHGDAHHYFPKELYRNGEKIEYPGNNLHEGTHYS